MIAAIKAGHVVCLLSDRDIAGDGIEVDFFGEKTTLPPGPVTVALRTGAPLIPTAVYFEGAGHHAVVGPPLDLTRQGRFRDDVTRLTQDLGVRARGAHPPGARAVAPAVAQLAQRLRRAGGHRPPPSPATPGQEAGAP